MTMISEPLVTNLSFMMRMALILITSIWMESLTAQAQATQADQPVLTIHPKPFLKIGDVNWVDIHFSRDERSAIVSSGLASNQHGISLLDCSTGKIKNLLKLSQLDHCFLPAEQDQFVIAVREEGLVWIEKYDLNGKRLERWGGKELDRNSGARVYWLPKLGKTFVILGNQIIELKKQGEFEQLLKLDFSISSVTRIAVHENHLFIPHKNKLHVVDLSKGSETEPLEFKDEVCCAGVSSESGLVFVVSSKTGYVTNPSTLSIVKRVGKGLKTVSNIELPYRPFKIVCLSDRRLLLSQPEGKTYCLDINSQKTLWVQNGGGVNVSPSKKTIAISTRNRIKLLSPDGQRISRIAGHDQSITQIHLDSKANELKTIQRDGLLISWNTATGKLNSFREFDSQTFCGANLERDEFICSSKDGLGYIDLSCYDSKGRLKYVASTILKDKPFRVTPIGDKKLLVINGKQTELYFWQGKKLELKYLLPETEQKNHKIANGSVSPDSTRLFVGVHDAKFEFETTGFRIVHLRDETYGRLQPAIALQPAVFDNSSAHVFINFAVVDKADKLRNAVLVFRLKNRKRIREINLPGVYDFAPKTALSPNGKWMACSRNPFVEGQSPDVGFVVMNVESGKLAKTVRFNGTPYNLAAISCLKFSSDSSKVIVAQQQGKIQVWSLNDLKQ